MNRSILIVICDFLLVSLLAFSAVDANKVGQASARSTSKMDLTLTNKANSSGDLAAVMQMALTEERKNREQLLGELTKSREAADAQQSLLAQREKQVQSFQQELQTRNQESTTLQQQQTNLQQQFATAQANLLALNEQLQNRSAESTQLTQRLSMIQAEAKLQSDQSAALQRQLADLARSNQLVQAEREKLATQLQVSEAEKRSATQEVARMADEVKVERAEKAKLAEGVKALASNSGQLVQEIRDNRPLAPNTIFNEFLTNRIQVRFDATKTGVFGSNRRKQAGTVLVTNGTNTFALCHVQDTPLTLWDPGTDWDALAGSLACNSATIPIRAVYFGLRDPRIVWVPVSPMEARSLGCRKYPVSSDPYKFQDAVLIGASEEYYGECKFEIDLSTPDYVKLDRNFLKGLFGKFNPSRGDLVFSKTGELLGVMANGSYCFMLRNFDSAATFQFGQDMRSQHTGAILSQLYLQVAQLPMKLQ